MRQLPREPTADECSALAPLGNGWFALWYPQMGGYAGRAAAWVDDSEGAAGCSEILVWHDGEFPFRDGDVGGWDDEPKRPVELHHCDPDQFRLFADHLDQIHAKRSANIGVSPVPAHVDSGRINN